MGAGRQLWGLFMDVGLACAGHRGLVSEMGSAWCGSGGQSMAPEGESWAVFILQTRSKLSQVQVLLPGPWAEVMVWQMICCLQASQLPPHRPTKIQFRNSLADQWLGLCAVTAEGTGSIPGRGTKIPQATVPKKGHSTCTSSLSLGRLSPALWPF